MAYDRTAFRFVGGARWLDLVSTIGGAHGPDPVERLPDTGRLDTWLGAVGLAPASGAATARDLDAARALRAVLRRLALSRARGEAPAADDLAALAAQAGHDPGATTLAVKRGAWLAAPPRDVDAALAQLAREAVWQLSGPEAAHLRVCGEPDCSLPFLDPSGRRRWCDSQRCGSRARVRALRARRSDA